MQGSLSWTGIWNPQEIDNNNIEEENNEDDDLLDFPNDSVDQDEHIPANECMECNDEEYENIVKAVIQVYFG